MNKNNGKIKKNKLNASSQINLKDSKISERNNLMIMIITNKRKQKLRLMIKRNQQI